MNYSTVPNYNYGYNYNYNPYTTVPNYPPQQQQQLPTLNGKIVDGAEVVKATEVPIGGYGIFPKADLSEIYLKTWNNNGTTSIVTFKPATTSQVDNDNDNMAQLIQKIDKLEEKIDSLKKESRANAF